MCDLFSNWERMARDDNTTTLMGESYFSGEWRERKEKRELIHSGHFMVSDPFKGDDKSNLKDSPEEPPGYDFEKYASSGTSETYKFNPTDLDIDSSFAKLFECLNLAYTGYVLHTGYSPGSYKLGLTLGFSTL